MPRAYRPRLTTTQRAGRVARLLSLSGWHLMSGTRVYYRDADGMRRVETLAALEE